MRDTTYTALTDSELDNLSSQLTTAYRQAHKMYRGTQQGLLSDLAMALWEVGRARVNITVSTAALQRIWQ